MCGDNNTHHHPPTQTPPSSFTHSRGGGHSPPVLVCVCVYIFTVIFLSFTERAVNYRHFTSTSSSSPPPSGHTLSRDCAHVCGCVRSCAHTHSLAFVDGFENKNLPAARPSSTTFLLLFRSSSPRGCFFLRYSGCEAPSHSHRRSNPCTDTHRHTRTHTHVQASKQPKKAALARRNALRHPKEMAAPRRGEKERPSTGHIRRWPPS